MSSSKLFLFSKEVRFNSGVRLLLIGIVLCCCPQARCGPLYYFGKINQWYSHVSVYLWTFTPLFSVVFVVSDLTKNFGGSTDLAKKRHGSADLHTPIHPPPTSIWLRRSHLKLFQSSCSCLSTPKQTRKKYSEWNSCQIIQLCIFFEKASCSCIVKCSTTTQHPNKAPKKHPV